MKYYLRMSPTHDHWGPTLHIAEDLRYPQVADPDMKYTAEIIVEHPEGIKAIAFFCKQVMGLHICYCDDA